MEVEADYMSHGSMVGLINLISYFLYLVNLAHTLKVSDLIEFGIIYSFYSSTLVYLISHGVSSR